MANGHGYLLFLNTLPSIVNVEVLRRFKSSRMSVADSYNVVFHSLLAIALIDACWGVHFYHIVCYQLTTLIPALYAFSDIKMALLNAFEVCVLHLLSYFLTGGSAFPDTHKYIRVALGTSIAAPLLVLGTVYAAVQDHKRRERILADAIKSKTLFISNMSHELRNPLHGIMATAELLMDTPLNGFQQEYLEAIQACGRHLTHVVGQVIDTARVESGKSPKPSKQKFNLIELVQDIGDGLVSMTDKRKINLVLDVQVPDVENDEIMTAPDMLPLIGDPGFLRQVLINMCSNAVRFSKPRGTVILQAVVEVMESPPTTPLSENGSNRGSPKPLSRKGSWSQHQTSTSMLAHQTARKHGEPPKGSMGSMSALFATFAPETSRTPTARVTFRIIDFGIGISKEFLPNLFKPFAQEHSHTRFVDSTGLGLSISKSLVEAMGGNIKVRSELGKGSEFEFSLVLERVLKPNKTNLAPALPVIYGSATSRYDTLHTTDPVRVELISKPQSELAHNITHYFQDWKKEFNLLNHHEWDLTLRSKGSKEEINSFDSDQNPEYLIDTEVLHRRADGYLLNMDNDQLAPEMIIIEHDFEVLVAIYSRLQTLCRSNSKPITLVFFTDIASHGHHSRMLENLSSHEKVLMVPQSTSNINLATAGSHSNLNTSYVTVPNQQSLRRVDGAEVSANAPMGCNFSVEVGFILRPAGRGKIYRNLKKMVKTMSAIYPPPHASDIVIAEVNSSTDDSQNGLAAQQSLSMSITSSLAASQNGSAASTPAAVNRRISLNQTIPASPLTVVESMLEPSTIFSYPVLVVEDNILNRKIVTTFLSRKKIAYDVAENGQVAYEMVKRRMDRAFGQWESAGSVQTDDLPFRLIMMDVQMPVMDGFESTMLIRAAEREWSERYSTLRKQIDVILPGGVPSIIVAMTGLAAQEVRHIY